MGVGRAPGCVLIGSGPSLNAVDVARLSRLDTIAFNRAYVAWPTWGFAPTMYACVDSIALESSADDIRGLIERHRTTRFFLPDGASAFGIGASTQVSYVRVVPGEAFSTNIHVLTDFGNVGATAIQLLAMLGYRRITMVGVDARYVEVDEGAVIGDDGLLRLSEDPNHFVAEYTRRKGPRPRPNLARVLGQWPRVASECERVNVAVRNASPGSALDCFPVADFASALDWTLDG